MQRIQIERAADMCSRILAAQRFVGQLSEDGAVQLAETLVSVAQSERHAEAILRAWVAQSDDMPTPHALYALADEVSDPEQCDAYVPPVAGCARCGGCGWEYVQCGMYGGVRRCQCAAQGREAA